MKTIQILWDDLTDEKQKKIAEIIGSDVKDVPGETNWGTVPMCSFDIGDVKDDNIRIVINDWVPYVSVDWETGSWFVQGDEASELLKSISDDVNREEYIIQYLTSAGVFA